MPKVLHEYADGRNPEEYARPIIDFAERWRAQYKYGEHTLSYRRGPGFTLIRDRRLGLPRSDYQLAEAEAAVYFACDAGATPAAVVRTLRARARPRLDLRRQGQVVPRIAA